MKATMSPAEFALFENLLSKAENYVEFGSGGSTFAASKKVGSSILTVDSSRQWLDKVKAACVEGGCRVVPNMIHVDIGRLGNWGTPIDPEAKPRWPTYHEAIWERPDAGNADLYLIDGRFRVACAFQVLVHCRSDAILAIHDFAPRPNYAVVHEGAREIARVGTLSVFVPRPNRNAARMQEIIAHHRYDQR